MSGEINRRLDQLQILLSDRTLARVGFESFRKYTPIRTGNAKRNTKLNGTQIQTDYPYARVLDEGRGYRDGQMRGSTQAPKGMSEPTIQDVTDYIKNQSKG